MESRKFDVLSLTVALCLATLPWGIDINVKTILIFGIGLLGYTIGKKKTIKIIPKDYFIGSAIFVVILLWLSITSNYEAGLKHLERSLSAVVFPFLFSIIYNQYRLNIHYVLVLFMFSCFLRYLLFLIGVIEIELVFIFDYWKEILIQFNQLFKESAMHPSYFSMFLGFCSMICYYYSMRAKKKLLVFFWMGTLMVFLGFNLSLMSKMPIVATILSLLIVSAAHLVRNLEKRKLLKIGVLMVLMAITSVWILVKVPNAVSQDIINYYKMVQDEEIEDIYDYNQLGINSSLDTWEKTNRLHIWKSSLDILKENLWVGVGTGDINDELNKRFMVNDKNYLASKNTNTHNQMLDYLIKYGILGFLFITCAFTMYYKKAWSEKNMLFLMFLILCSLCMITENILNRQMGIVFFFYLNSLFYFFKENSNEDPRKLNSLAKGK